VSALGASELPIARFRGDVRPPRRNIFSRYLNTRLTDGVAVSNERLKIEYEKKFGANRIPYRVIYPGLDSARYKVNMPKGDLKRKFGLNPGAPVVGIVGRLSTVKGHRYFIEAAKLVSLKNPRAQYVIAGEDVDGDLAKLQISASILKVPNIKFLGRIENIEELISAFDIGVISSIGSEMISRVLLEYFAAGIPAVATSINQISEIMLQSDGGILVPPADSVTMGNAIVDLLNDQTKRLRIGGNGEQWVAGRSLEVFGRESEAFLREVLDAQ
jgi:glycosyltransferase involved in cell wall biosynthesis